MEGQSIEPVNTLTFDLGLHYARAFGNDNVRARYLGAWSLTNVGGTVVYGESYERALPTMMRGGLGMELEFARRWLDRPAVRVGFYGAASKMIVA